jgi:hypothetical protein
MTIINSLLRRLFDAALSPFSGLHPLVGIAVVSLLFGIVMLLVFKVTSNQDKLAAVKRKIHAGLFEIRLFNDDLRAILRAIGAILRHNLSYIGLSMVPLLWMIVPLVLVIVQLQFHYGYQGLEPGDRALVKVEVADSTSRPQIRLEAPPGLEVEAGPVWIPAEKELSWRISAAERGDYELSFVTGGETVTKSVVVSDRVVRISPIRVARGFVDQLLYPAEDPLPDSTPIRKITVTYPAGNAGFEGWENELTWMLCFVLLSVVFAFALRKPLKVTI